MGKIAKLYVVKINRRNSICLKKMISFEISDELREKLRVEAFKRKLTISASIREILEAYFKEKEC